MHRGGDVSDRLRERLNAILPKITSDAFLKGHGIGNEIAFHIFDYPPADELIVRDHVRFLIAQIPKLRPGLRTAHVNLFDFVIEYLRERNLLDKAIEIQRTKGDEALLKALKGPLHEEKVANRFKEIVRPEENDLVFVAGVGSVYPMLRTHTLLNNLHSRMGATPLVLFYPGKYDNMTLRLFGKTSLGNIADDGKKKKTVPYYRAFRLIN
jgi:hypothetical protein